MVLGVGFGRALGLVLGWGKVEGRFARLDCETREGVVDGFDAVSLESRALRRNLETQSGMAMLVGFVYWSPALEVPAKVGSVHECTSRRGILAGVRREGLRSKLAGRRSAASCYKVSLQHELSPGKNSLCLLACCQYNGGSGNWTTC